MKKNLILICDWAGNFKGMRLYMPIDELELAVKMDGFLFRKEPLDTSGTYAAYIHFPRKTKRKSKL